MKYLMSHVLVVSILSVLTFVPISNADCGNVIYLATNHFYDSCENLSEKLVKIQEYEDKISKEEYKLQNALNKNNQKLDLNFFKLDNSCNNKKLKLLQKIFFLESKLSGFNSYYSNNCNFGYSNFCSNNNNWGYYSGNWYNQSNKLFSLYVKLESTTAKCQQKLASYEFKTYWWTQKAIQKAESKIESYELKIYEIELDAVEDYKDIDTFNEVIISCGGSPESCFHYNNNFH